MSITRSLELVGVVLASVSGTTAVAQQGEAEAVTYVAESLESAIDQMVGRRYVIRQGFIGHVDAGSAFSHPIRTDRGGVFTLKGFYDGDCNDMDLEVVDGSGTVLFADNDTDPTPELTFRSSDLPPRNVSVRVKMYQCSTPVCYYSVGLFSR